MEKVAFSNFNLKVNDEIKKVDINGIEVEVKQYLPIDKQIEIVTNVLLNSADDNNFANPMKVEVYFNLELIYAYTNIEFTAAQKEQANILYDLLESNDIFNQVIAAIPDNQYSELWGYVTETIEAYYKHVNSALGILEQVSTDYKDLNFDVDSLKEKMSKPDIQLLKDVVEKLG